MKIFRATAAISAFAVLILGGALIQQSSAQDQAKAPVYFVVENEIHDVRNYLQEYAPRAREMIRAHGGRYLAAGDATTFAGEPPKSRVAIFVFDNLQQIEAWLKSPEYEALKKIGEKYAKFRNYAVPGIPQ